MKAIWKVAFSFCMGLSFIWATTAKASGSVPSVSSKPKFYFGVEFGGSFSNSAAMKVPSYAAVGGEAWDPTPNGYNAKLGNTFIYGAGVGYNVVPLVSLELNYLYRPSYSYKKVQSSGTVVGNKTRYFDLSNTTLMLNSVWHLGAISHYFRYENGSFSLEPFVDIGAGLARSKVSNFHSVSQSTPGYVFSKMVDKTSDAFAYEIGAGFGIEFNSHWLARIGYRYFDGGKFKTQNYLTDDPDDLHPGCPGAGTLTNPWRGSLRTNEVYFKLAYRI